MNKKSVLNISVVLLCFCLSFGNGEERLRKARKSLRNQYKRLLPYLEDPDTLRHRSTIWRHLNDVNRKQKTWKIWLLDETGYSIAQLNNPVGSMIGEDELKVATEYHLFLSGWYYVRFLTLKSAAECEGHDPLYLRKAKCRKASLIALNYSTYHKDLYTQFYQALGEKAQQNIMKELKFSNYLVSEKQNPHAIANVILHLESQIERIARRKQCMDSYAVKGIHTMESFMSPSGMTLNEDFMSGIRNLFPVVDLSQPPDKASRSDEEFLKVAWLLNGYRSLWYEIRHLEFLKFLRHKKQDLKAEFIQRVEKAIELANKLFEQYSSLYNDYYERFEKFQTVTAVIAQDTPSKSNTQLHISEHCKRKRKPLQLMKCPKFDLNEPALEIEEDLCLGVAPLELHENLYSCVTKNSERSHDATDMDAIAPKRLKLTQSEENHSQLCPHLDNVHQSSPKKYTSGSEQTMENLSSSLGSQAVTF